MNKTRYVTLSLAALAALLLAPLAPLQAGPTTPPVLVGHDPGHGSHDVPSRSPITLTYDQPMDPATVDSRTFAVHAFQTGWLTGIYVVNGANVTLDPLSGFHAGEVVQVSATTGMHNLGGEGPAAPHVWTFSVAPTLGSALFTHHQALDVPDFRSAAFGDLDGDGDLDLFTANCADVHVYSNDGTGTFTETQHEDMDAYCIVTVALGDLEGDGDLDAIALNGTSTVPNRIMLNDGQGHFDWNTPSFKSYANTHGALGDLDGDGDLDLFTVSEGPNRVWKYYDHFTFALEQTFDSTYLHASVQLGDLDNDGDLDAFTAGMENSFDKVWLNDGTGLFTEAQSIGGANTIVMVLGDLDDDGDLDAYRSEASIWDNLPDQVWLNDGTGHFTDTGQRLATPFTFAPALGDLDADGDLDVYLSDYESSGIDEVWANNGTGTFTLLRTIDVGTRGYFALLGDLNGNGSLDVASLGIWSKMAHIYLQPEPGLYLPVVTRCCGKR